MRDNDLQRRLFEAILRQFPDKATAMARLRDLLGKSPDGVYRRLRGSTALTADEFARLAYAFGISMDALAFEGTEKALFSYTPLHGEIEAVDDYLGQVLDLARRLSQVPELRVTYTSQEIPVFLYYVFPHLFTFKMFLYGRTYWDLPETRGRRFSLERRWPRAERMAAQVADIYFRLDSTELWSPDLFNRTLSQIRFFLEADQFERPADALTLCQSLRDLLDWVRDMARRGRKHPPGQRRPRGGGRYRLYVNDFSSTNDSILVRGPEVRTLITSFGTPNYLLSDDERFGADLEGWMDSLTGRATPLSEGHERARGLFFRSLHKRLAKAERRLAAHL